MDYNRLLMILSGKTDGYFFDIFSEKLDLEDSELDRHLQILAADKIKRRAQDDTEGDGRGTTALWKDSSNRSKASGQAAGGFNGAVS